MINLHADLQGHDCHHDFPQAGDKKRGHIYRIHAQAQVVIQTLLQQLAVGIGGGHGEQPRVALQTLHMQAVQRLEQSSGGRIQVTLAQPQIHLVNINRRLPRSGVGPGFVKLGVEASQKSLSLPLGYQAGKQLLILLSTQIQPQLILECFE